MFRSRESLCIIINNRPVSCKVDRLQRQTSECIIEAVRLRDFKARGDQSAASSEPVIPFSIPEVAHTELAVGEKQREKRHEVWGFKGPTSETSVASAVKVSYTKQPKFSWSWPFFCHSITIDPSQKPVLLSYCCYVQQSMPLSHYTHVLNRGVNQMVCHDTIRYDSHTQRYDICRYLKKILRYDYDSGVYWSI